MLRPSGHFAPLDIGSILALNPPSKSVVPRHRPETPQKQSHIARRDFRIVLSKMEENIGRHYPAVTILGELQCCTCVARTFSAICTELLIR